MKKTIYKYLLLAYALLSSIFLGGLIGFLIIYPFLQILSDKLESNYGYDSTQALNYLVYPMVILTILVFMYINLKRYLKYVRKQ
jgi:hypothetical protein